MTDSETILNEYHEFLSGRGHYPDVDLCALELTGKDRVTFLHGFCTADVKRLTSGDSAEAFVLDTRGKTLAFVQILVNDNTLWVVVPVKQRDLIQTHLEKYLIVEDVRIDHGKTRFHWTVDSPPGCFSTNLGKNVQVNLYPIENGASPSGSMASTTQISRSSFDMIRIENRFPLSGVDVLPDNLPQEFDRDRTAISFEKGCYLGQETVARLDALGHTNRTLCLAASNENCVPDIDLDPTVNGKVCGRFTSACWSPRFEAFIALGMIRKPHHQPGTRIRLGPAEMTVLPPG